MKKRIWFNRTFATAYHFIDMIKTNPDGKEFEVFATHPKRHSVMLQKADYAEIEPILKGEEYIQYCLGFCQKHHIDIFIPNFQLVEIAKHLEAFRRIETQVLVCPDEELLQTVSDKGKLFDLFKGIKGIALPEYHIVKTAGQFMDAYLDLKNKGHKVCFKPATGEGGAGFRMIEDEEKTFQSLLQPVTNKISFNEAYNLLLKQETFDDLMIMEFLNGYEYSIDCLAFNGKLLAAVPRKKEAGRIRFLEDNKELHNIAQVVSDTTKLPFNFNIQIIYKDGFPKLLEINPRTSGGLYISCLSGINFPYLAVKLLLDGEVNVPTPQFGIYGSNYEQEFIMKRIF